MSTVDAKRVPCLHEGDGLRPGAFKFFTVDNEVAGFNFRCPCGLCTKIGSVLFSPPASQGWKWDGDADAPTINPSVNFDQGHWHGFLKLGKWLEC